MHRRHSRELQWAHIARKNLDVPFHFWIHFLFLTATAVNNFSDRFRQVGLFLTRAQMTERGLAVEHI